MHKRLLLLVVCVAVLATQGRAHAQTATPTPTPTPTPLPTPTAAPECHMLVSRWVHDIAAGVILGNSAANTAYDLLFPTAGAAEAPVTQNADTIRFRLQPGRWSIDIYSSQYLAGSALRVIDTSNSALVHEGVLAIYGMAEVHQYLVLDTSEMTIKVQQWFVSAVSAGRGYCYPFGACRMALIEFDWRPLDCALEGGGGTTVEIGSMTVGMFGDVADPAQYDTTAVGQPVTVDLVLSAGDIIVAVLLFGVFCVTVCYLGVQLWTHSRP